MGSICPWRTLYGLSARLLPPDQVADRRAVIGIASGRDLRTDLGILPFGQRNGLAHDCHGGLQRSEYRCSLAQSRCMAKSPFLHRRALSGSLSLFLPVDRLAPTQCDRFAIPQTGHGCELSEL